MQALERESRVWYFRERKKVCVFEVNCVCLGKRMSRKRFIYGKARTGHTGQCRTG